MAALISNGTATGGAVQWAGGRGFVAAVASAWNGATVALQVVGPDGSTWMDAATALSANGGSAFNLPPGRIRAAVTGGPPTGVYVSVEQVRA